MREALLFIDGKDIISSSDYQGVCNSLHIFSITRNFMVIFLPIFCYTHKVEQVYSFYLYLRYSLHRAVLF